MQQPVVKARLVEEVLACWNDLYFLAFLEVYEAYGALLVLDEGTAS